MSLLNEPLSRRHSFSSGDEREVRPHMPSIDHVARRSAPRRARIPRSKSASNMLDMYSSSAADVSEPMREIAREQIDRESLRALAEFFRNTAPPPTNHHHISAEDCFGRTAPGDSRRWSIQSLRKGKKSKFRPHSLQLRLPDSAVPGTTSHGHRYIAISIPIQQNANGPWFRSQYPVFTPSPSLTRDTNWPERTSSRGALGPSSPTTERTASRGSTKAFEIDAVPPRSSSSSHGTIDQDKHSTRTSFTVNSSSGGERTVLNPVDEGHESELESQERAKKPAVDAATWFADSDDDRRVSQIIASSLSSNSPTPDLPQGSKAPRISLPPTGPPLVTLNFPTTPPPIEERQQSMFNEPTYDRFPASPPGPMTAPKPLQHRRQLSTFPSAASSPGSPKSPRKSPKNRPANILLRPTLQVPKDAPLPDSPGFPNMLAAMTFPSPPKCSPSHSPASSINTIAPSPTSSPTPPLVQPRRSSSRATTTAASPAASLNEIMMRPPLNHLKSDSALQNSYTKTKPHSQLHTSTSASNVRAMIDKAESRGQSDQSQTPEPYANDDKSMRSESAASFFTAQSERPISMDTTVTETHEFSNRDSTGSNITVTTDSYRQSGTTDDTFRQSTRSDTTALTATTDPDSFTPKKPAAIDVSCDVDVDQDVATPKGNQLVHEELPMSESASEQTRSAAPTPEPRFSDDRRRSTASTISMERSDTPTSSCSLSTVTSVDGTKHGSIAERRMARKAKVREYKQRDLAESRLNVKTPRTLPLGDFDSVDSPVLGWFNQQSGGARSRKSLQGPSPLAQGSSASVSRSSTPTMDSSRTRTPSLAPSSRRSSMQLLETVPEAEPSVEPRSKSAREWGLSSVMVEETVPESASEAEENLSKQHQTTELTISPIMIIAHLESKTGQNTLRPLSLLGQHDLNGISPPHPPPRSALRTKVRSQRPLPIKIAHLSPSSFDRTGGTRNVRNSFPNMPTPPLSPDAAVPLSPSSRRMSLPLQPMGSATAPVAPPPNAVLASSRGTGRLNDRTSLARRREKEQREQENKWLLAHQREREQEWRVAAVKERLRREKMEKEREIAEMVANSIDVSTSASAASSLSSEILKEEDEEDAEGDLQHRRQQPQKRATSAAASLPSPTGSDDLERRLQRLEQNGDSWMCVMMPLLEKMNRTLSEMQRDGMAGGLTMGDFIVDMDAEARRLSCHSNPTTPMLVSNGRGGQGPLLERLNVPLTPSSKTGKPNALPETVEEKANESQDAAPAAPVVEQADDKKDNSQPEKSNTVIPVSGPSEEFTLAPGPEDDFDKELPPLPRPPFAEAQHERPRTPQEHEAEAQMAIQKRMEAQEAMMGELMKSWGTSTATPKSKKGRSRTMSKSSLKSGRSIKI